MIKQKIKNFFKLNIKPRYSIKYGLKIHPFLSDLTTEKIVTPYGDHESVILLPEKHVFDENGIYKTADNHESFYNVCGIAIYSLVCYDHLIRLNETSKEKEFLIQIKWLEENVEYLEPNKALWNYKYPDQKQFFSSISQGFIISAFVRAWLLTKESKYKKLAIDTYNFLITPIEEGGLKANDGTYVFWLEEYLEHPKILNGHIYALFGIWDLYRITGDKEIKKSFDAGLNDVINNLNDFDLGFFSKYAASDNNPANNSYHYTHITQLRVLFLISGNKKLKIYADKFERYQFKFQYKILNVSYILFKVLRARISKK